MLRDLFSDVSKPILIRAAESQIDCIRHVEFSRCPLFASEGGGENSRQIPGKNLPYAPFLKVNDGN